MRSQLYSRAGIRHRSPGGGREGVGKGGGGGGGVVFVRMPKILEQIVEVVAFPELQVVERIQEQWRCPRFSHGQGCGHSCWQQRQAPLLREILLVRVMNTPAGA